MKKQILLGVFMLQILTNLYAAEIEPPGTPLRKLQRGFLNIALAPIEVEHHLVEANKEETMPPSWFFGIGKGAAATAGRMLIGAYEMLTFPFPAPASYKPIVEPEFTWQYLNGNSKPQSPNSK